MIREKIEYEGVVLEFNRPHPTQFQVFAKKFLAYNNAFVAVQEFLHSVSVGKCKDIMDFTNLSDRVEGAYIEAEQTAKKYHQTFYKHFKDLDTSVNSEVWNRENFEKYFSLEDEKSLTTMFRIGLNYTQLTLTEAEVKN